LVLKTDIRRTQKGGRKKSAKKKKSAQLLKFCRNHKGSEAQRARKERMGGSSTGRRARLGEKYSNSEKKGGRRL